MKPCPRCSLSLADNAKSCDCGWSERSKPKSFHDYDNGPRCYCQHDGCIQRAVAKIFTPAPLSLCHQHYESYYTNKAANTCAKLNLTTPEAKREYVRAQLRKNPLFANLERLYQAEPGEDWTE